MRPHDATMRATSASTSVLRVTSRWTSVRPRCRKGVAADIAGDADVGGDDPRAALDQGIGERSSDASSTSGHERHAVGETR